MFFKKNQQVCMEIRDNVIRFAELKSTEPVVVKRYGERYIPDGMVENGKIIDVSQFKLFMADCITHWKLKNKRIMFVEPNEAVAVKTVTVPYEVADEEMRGYLYIELGESIILPFEDPSIDYVLLSESEEGKEVLLVATPYELVTSYAEIFSSNRVKPVAADIAPLCYYRLYMNQMQVDKNPEEVMILQVDISSVTISIFEHHIPIFMQYEALAIEHNSWSSGDLVDGENHVAWEGSKEEMLASFEYLMGDIERILHFYQFSISSGNNIKKIIAVGDNPYLEELVKIMIERFDLPTKMIPTSIQTINGDIVPREYQLAIGLGLKGV